MFFDEVSRTATHIRLSDDIDSADFEEWKSSLPLTERIGAKQADIAENSDSFLEERGAEKPYRRNQTLFGNIFIPDAASQENLFAAL
jgi:hypothetical protein